MGNVTLGAIFTARDRISTELEKMSSNGNKFTDTLKKIAKAGAAAFAVKKVSDFTKDSIAEFGNFQQGMNQVFTMLPGISQNAMDNMTAQVKNFSKEFGALPEEVVPALYQSLSAGVPESNVFDFLAIARKSSVAGIADIETSVDALTNVVNSYGADAINAQQASDMMFTTARLGKTTFGELAGSLYNVLPSAAASGVGFRDVSAAMAAMTAQGTPTAQATTRIRAAIDELSKSGTKTDKIFKEVAGKSFKKFIADGGNLQTALQKLEGYAKKNNLSMNDLFASIEAGGAALQLTGQGTDKFTESMKAMADSAGATDEAYDKMNQGIKVTLERMKANFKVMMLDIGDKFAPGLEKAGNFMMDVFPPVANTIAWVFGLIGGAIETASEKFEPLKRVVGNLANDFFPRLEGSGKTLGQTIKDIVAGAFDTLITCLEWIEDHHEGVKTAIEIITAAWLTYQGTLIVVTFLQTLHTLALGGTVIATGLSTAATIGLYLAYFVYIGVIGIATAAQWLFNAALAASPIVWVVGLVVLLIGTLIILYNKSETARNAINKLWSDLRTGAETSINQTIGKINWLIETINKIPAINIPTIGYVNFGGGKVDATSGAAPRGKSTSPKKPSGGFDPFAQNKWLRKRAHGDFSTPDTFLAGEKGPELITNAPGRSVIPAQATKDLLSGRYKWWGDDNFDNKNTVAEGDTRALLASTKNADSGNVGNVTNIYMGDVQVESISNAGITDWEGFKEKVNKAVVQIIEEESAVGGNVAYDY